MRLHNIIPRYIHARHRAYKAMRRRDWQWFKGKIGKAAWKAVMGLRAVNRYIT